MGALLTPKELLLELLQLLGLGLDRRQAARLGKALTVLLVGFVPKSLPEIRNAQGGTQSIAVFFQLLEEFTYWFYAVGCVPAQVGGPF